MQPLVTLEQGKLMLSLFGHLYRCSGVGEGALIIAALRPTLIKVPAASCVFSGVLCFKMGHVNQSLFDL